MSWNKPSAPAPQPAPKKSPTVLRGALAGLVVVVLGLAALWIFSGNDAAPKAKVEKKARTIKEVKPAAAPKAEEPVDKEKKQAVKKIEKVYPKPDFIGKIPYAEMDSTQRAIRADYYAFKAKSVNFEKVVVDHTKYAEPRLLDDPVQCEFLKYFEIGTMQPPTGRISDQAAMNAIVKGVQIKEDDPPEVVAKKEDVKLMLDDLKEYMKQGHTAQEYFDAMDRRQELEASTMEEAHRQANELINSGDEKLAAATIRKYNEYLTSKGLPEMKSARFRKILKKYPQTKGIQE